MLSHDTVEKERNELVISDLDPRAVQRLIKFMSGGILEDLEEDAEEMLIAADKYQVQAGLYFLLNITPIPPPIHQKW